MLISTVRYARIVCSCLSLIIIFSFQSQAKHVWLGKKDGVESCKTDYGASLSAFNTNQTQHFEVQMPKVFQVSSVICRA